MHKKLFYYSLSFLTMAAVVSSCTSEKSTLTYSPEESKMILISDSSYEEDPEMTALIAPYKLKMDSIMTEVIGHCDETIDSRNYDSGLPPFVTDIMRSQAEKVTGEKVDVALVNLGGLRSPLYKGDVTIGSIFSIFPFENALTLITVKGKDLKALYKVVAERKRLAVTVLPNIVDNKEYRLATIDYLVDGNDNASALKSATNRTDTKVLLRDLIIDYYRSTQKK
ncbi:MAG: 5'-nucleotidase C-terminal domain-containing protein [Bacteroidales bacterium]